MSRSGDIAQQIEAVIAEKGESWIALPFERDCAPEGTDHYFFEGAIASLADLATRNLTTVLALILMAWPVCGLRPMRAFRSAFTSRPMPGMTKTPFFLVSLMVVSA